MTEDVQQIVREMNDAIFYSSVSEHDYIAYLELIQTPIGNYIKYMGCYIWDSENDYRDYKNDPITGEEIDEKEDLKQYLTQEIAKIQHIIKESLKSVRKST